MMLSTKIMFVFFLVIALLVIAIMARECTHRGKEAALARQLDALTAESQDRAAEIERQAGRIDALRAELEAAKKLYKDIEIILTETGETKELIHETISNDDESRDWYMERIPDALLRAFDVRVCAPDKDRDTDRVCRAE